MAQTFMFMCWLAIAGVNETGSLPLPEELLSDQTVVIHRLDATKINASHAQATLAYLLQALFGFHDNVAAEMEALPENLERFLRAGGREIVIIVDSASWPEGWKYLVTHTVTLAIRCEAGVPEQPLVEATRPFFFKSIIHKSSVSEIQWRKSGEIRPWLVFSEKDRNPSGKPGSAHAALLKEAFSVAASPVCTVIVPSPAWRDQPQWLEDLVCASSFSPDIAFSALVYSAAGSHPWDWLRDADWLVFDMTLGVPPVIKLTVRTSDTTPEARVVEGVKNLRGLLHYEAATWMGVYSQANVVIESKAATQTSRLVRLSIVPGPVFIAFLAPGSQFERPSHQRPDYKKYLSFGHFREVVIRSGSGQYRLPIFSAPPEGTPKPRSYSCLRVLQEPLASQPADPAYRDPSRLLAADVNFDLIRVPFAIGTVRYDPVADEILLVERQEMGKRKQVLKHLYRVIWKAQEYDGTNDRFSQEAEAGAVLQSDDKLMAWRFLSRWLGGDQPAAPVTQPSPSRTRR